MRKNLLHLIKRVKETQEQEINCSECLDQISTYVDLELSTDAAAERMPLVKQHLDQCGICMDEYQVLHSLAKSEAEGDLPTNESLAEQLKRRAK